MTIQSGVPSAAKASGWMAFCQALAAANSKQVSAVSKSTQKGTIRDANSGR
jgi:hypothetical protein